MSDEWHHLDATAIAAGVRLGRWSAPEVAEYFLGRIQLHEPQLQTLVAFNPDRVRAQAARVELAARKGALAGVPIGIKDVFDTFDHPTEFFSPLYAGNQPSRDAYAVARLRQVDGVIVGKTHTTEFAFMHTGPTRNPHDLRRTPGSSSAGSAAGVAAGLFPVAFGTQTAGSLIKPAAYCGVFGYKPSFGLVSLEGVKPLAPSFDTIGWYARSARDLGLVARELIPDLPHCDADAPRARIGFCRTPHWQEAEAEVAFAIERAVDCIAAAGHSVTEVPLPCEFDGVCADHQLINDIEGARSLRVEAGRGKLSPETLAMITRAESTTWSRELAAKRRLASLGVALEKIFQSFDAIVAPSCGRVAPLGVGSTGPSDFIKFWTAFGLPQANVPLPRATGQLPLGLQLIGAFRNDAGLLRVVERIAEAWQPNEPLYQQL